MNELNDSEDIDNAWSHEKECMKRPWSGQLRVFHSWVCLMGSSNSFEHPGINEFNNSEETHINWPSLTP
ncbi:hypothetical protein BT93_A1089 [Corymbia citriodora subsp. variegata]|nr:hypothetical protein BT93_A1089 [Corymbia citriodora subsp. variegata]